MTADAARNGVLPGGYVYILGEPKVKPYEGWRLCKVGFASRDTRARLAQAQLGNPRDLQVLAELCATPLDERAAHRYLTDRGCHLRGEWFYLSERALTVAGWKTVQTSQQWLAALASECYGGLVGGWSSKQLREGRIPAPEPTDGELLVRARKKVELLEHELSQVRLNSEGEARRRCERERHRWLNWLEAGAVGPNPHEEDRAWTSRLQAVINGPAQG